MVLERLSWHVTCPNHASFWLLTVARQRFLWTHKEVDLVPRPVIGLVLQVGDNSVVSSGIWVRKSAFFFSVSKQGPCFTTVEEDGGDKRHVELEFACKAYRVAPLDPV